MKENLDKFSIRKFPYPFRCALTICNDIDGTSFDDFLTIHYFLNTNKNTVLGRGLELELADSFWFYSNKNTPDNAFSYFEQDLKSESRYAPIIRDLIHSGYIDTLHTYGNFSIYGGFTRSFAEKCIEEIEKHSLKIEIWVNHGDEQNTQNIGNKKYWLGSKPFIYKNGNKTKNKSYHLDLLISCGFKYFWDTETSLSKIIGQERDYKWHENFTNNKLLLSPTDKIKNLVWSTAEVINHTSNKYFKRNIIKTPFDNTFNNKLLMYEKFEDHNFMLKFCRFGSGRYDWSEDLAFLLRDDVLSELIHSEGYCILYIHWGDRKYKNNTLPFSNQTVKAFYNLANKFYDGFIWISTTKKILNYAYISQNLKWTKTKNANGWTIHISEKLNSNFEDNKITHQDIEGITFYVPESRNIEIYFKKNKLRTIKNPKDSTGKYSISIPLKRFSFPDL